MSALALTADKRVTRRTATPATEPATEATEATEAKVPATAAPAAARTLTDEMTDERLGDLFDKAQGGDANVWRELRPILDHRVPDWETRYASPTEQARRSLLEAVVGNNLLVREAWLRRARTMTTELAGGPDASPLERVLCERVATCWLDMALAELSYASRAKNGMSFEAGEHFQRMQDQAHKRYLSACTALAKVRRLLAPVAQQINIAQPGAAQLNVAAPSPAQTTAPATLPAPAKTVDASVWMERLERRTRDDGGE